MIIFAICIVFLFDLIDGLLGLCLSRTRKLHWLGIRLMAMSVSTCWAVPHLCSCECCGSCRNWTCPQFHSVHIKESASAEAGSGKGSKWPLSRKL